MILFNTNYERLDRLTGGLKDFLNSKDGYLKLKSTGFMDLTVERIAPDTISLTHYFEQNGDLCTDCDVTVKINLNTAEAEALTYQDMLMYRTVYSQSGTINQRYQKQLNKFLSQWLINLKSQGFYK